MNKLFIYLLIIPAMLSTKSTALAQDSIDVQQKQRQQINTINQSIDQAYSNIDEGSISKSYEDLAKVFSDKKEYTKAEEYLKKALAIYTKLNFKNKKARVARNLAKVQEELGKQKDALYSYDIAKQESTNKIDISINDNDYNRLYNNSNPPVQKGYTNSNINIFKKQGNNEELSFAYFQQAKNDVHQNNTSGAVENYNNALKYSANGASQGTIINGLTNVYLSNNQFDQAKKIQNDLISNSIKTNDVNTEIQQKQSLAAIFLQEKNDPEAIKLLQESYQKALATSNTIEAKKSLEQLINYYQGKGNYEKSIQLYGQFFKTLEQLVKSDSSLMDTKLLEATENKIKQLEKEKGLQDQLIEKKNTFSYFLVGGILLVIIFLLFLVKAFYSVKNKNREIALQSLRREMNPHFIFNSLNSVNQFIAENKELEANKYLSSYSNLMRNVMENSNKDFISLSNEIELVKKYLDLEHLRFNEKFDYKIIVDEKLDPDSTLIPNMIMQPQLENAVWHGLRYKEIKGMLEIKFSIDSKIICIKIEDDGIGLAKSKELKTLNQKTHVSRGLNNTMERIKLLNELYKKKIELNIIEKTETQGTIVEIRFPLMSKI